MRRFGGKTQVLPAILARVASQLQTMALGVAFWTAITLPFVYIPLLLLTGLNRPPLVEAFILLVAAHVCSLFVGRQYPRI